MPRAIHTEELGETWRCSTNPLAPKTVWVESSWRQELERKC